MPASRGDFELSYIAQASVDTETMLVVIQHVSQAPNDKREIAAVLDRIAALPEDQGQAEGSVSRPCRSGSPVRSGSTRPCWAIAASRECVICAY